MIILKGGIWTSPLELKNEFTLSHLEILAADIADYILARILPNR